VGADNFIKKRVLRVIERMEKAIHFDASVNGMASGLRIFDRWTNGRRPSELTLIAGGAGTDENDFKYVIELKSSIPLPPARRDS